MLPRAEAADRGRPRSASIRGLAGPALGLVTTLLVACGGDTFRVTMQDSAMEPTFTARAEVRFRRATAADRGDVIAFEYPFPYPGEPRRALIARVIGLAGDELKIEPGGVLLNGRRLAEPYAKHLERMAAQVTTVPPGHYFVLGDDRANQRDSRWWGPLPAEKLLGVRVPDAGDR